VGDVSRVGVWHACTRIWWCAVQTVLFNKWVVGVSAIVGKVLPHCIPTPLPITMCLLTPLQADIPVPQTTPSPSGIP
jgi:hypothetical protein